MYRSQWWRARLDRIRLIISKHKYISVSIDYLLSPIVISFRPGLLKVCSLRRARGILDGLAGNDEDDVDTGWMLVGRIGMLVCGWCCVAGTPLAGRVVRREVFVWGRCCVGGTPAAGGVCSTVGVVSLSCITGVGCYLEYPSLLVAHQRGQCLEGTSL